MGCTRRVASCELKYENPGHLAGVFLDEATKLIAETGLMSEFLTAWLQPILISLGAAIIYGIFLSDRIKDARNTYIKKHQQQSSKKNLDRVIRVVKGESFLLGMRGIQVLLFIACVPFGRMLSDIVVYAVVGLTSHEYSEKFVKVFVSQNTSELNGNISGWGVNLFWVLSLVFFVFYIWVLFSISHYISEFILAFRFDREAVKLKQITTKTEAAKITKLQLLVTDVDTLIEFLAYYSAVAEKHGLSHANLMYYTDPSDSIDE